MPDFEPTAEEALTSLVSQFSSALDCFRELVQNSIDAGSPSVEVWLDYIPGESGEGTIAIHVDDFGEGMDEAIIDEQLTKLFASSKEHDLTKIGKFGIGFVSVFALKPKAVLVHTGRGGEYWEILFHEDRSFTKTRTDTPTEGTQLTLFIAGDRYRYNDLAHGTRETLKRWCSHSETEVYFEDRTDPDNAGPELINEPFEVAGDCHCRSDAQGTEIVLAYHPSPAYGFYNKGLTLLRTSDAEEALGDEASRFGHVTFKIKSRYLEHTLSRETVLKDLNYEKAMTLLREAADGPLRERLLAQITEITSRGRLSTAELERYMELLTHLCHEPEALLLDLDDRPILLDLFGGTLTPKQLWRALRRDGRVFISTERSTITETLRDQEVPVVHGRLPLSSPDEEGGGYRFIDPVRRLLLHYLAQRERKTLLGRISSTFGVNLRADALDFGSWSNYDPKGMINPLIADPHAAFISVELDDKLPLALRDLIHDAEDILIEADAGYSKLTTCVLGTAEVDPPLFVVGRRLAKVMARPPKGVSEKRRMLRPTAAVNREHPQLRALAAAYPHNRALGAYSLAKSLLLTEDRLLHLDVHLMEAAIRAHSDLDKHVRRDGQHR